ncbi:polysaccharide deacetylase family protein [Pseudonocardia benzenivorans]|uniref:Polysaccharide deacetylase family protein n=1 Tax=Pseudonocardia benzenivorans TaxID=228005 RepID=A0ABW3VPX2_9PSEU
MQDVTTHAQIRPVTPAAPGRPRLNAASAVLTALVFGLVTFLTAPDSPFRAVTPPPPPPPAPVVVQAVPKVLTEVRGQPGPRTVALTFDDGPDPTWTPRILDVLRSHGAVATFCQIGNVMAAHPETVAMVAAAGMRMCSHSRTHDESLSTRAESTVVAEIVDVRDRAEHVPGADVEYFRAPGGYWSPTMLTDAATRNLQPLGWSVDPRDWKRPGVDAIVAAVQKQVHPGAIVLLHDGGGNRSQTVAALERLLPWLSAQGYTFTFP